MLPSERPTLLRRPPQSNYPPGTVSLLVQGLEPKLSKSGISPAAPPRLAPRLLSLPPILHMLSLSPMPSCSKAPRGLFVLSRVVSIFTHTSISPGPSLRQRPSRYAFPAGRNLPDKGFRYLRQLLHISLCGLDHIFPGFTRDPAYGL